MHILFICTCSTLIPLFTPFQHPSIQQFSEKVQRYNKKLALFGIKDHQVEKISIGGLRAAWIFLERLIGLASICLAVLPGLILHAPIAYIVSEMAEKKARGKTIFGL